MKLLRSLSIRRKQMLLIMLTSAVALLLACAAFMSYDALAFRRELVERISSLAEVVGNNTTAAIDFNDAVAATQTLAALRGEPNVVQARVYRLNGELFASYARAGGQPPPGVAYRAEASEVFAAQHLHLFRPIVQSAEPIGTIEVVANLAEARERLWRYAGIVAIVFVGALGVAFWLSAILGRVVAAPILHLSRVAQAVAQDKNYSVRATKESEDELGHLMDGFNEMLAQIQARDLELERSRNQLEERVAQRTQELASSLSLLNSTIESTADGIVAFDLSGRFVSFNSKFMAMWGVPREIMEQWRAPEFKAHAEQLINHPERFLQMIELSRTQPEAEMFDLVEFKDGRVFERYAMPQRIDNKCVGVVVNWREVTARKAAEAELERTHRQLIETSRQAGMAEVATSVLHNVGNVLNSVNTSATVVADRLKRAGTEGLVRLAEMLQANRQDLTAFLSAAGRAEHVIEYLNTLAQHLDAGHRAVLEELKQLTQNIDHIKEIVVMQQNYAKISGLTETVKVTDLVEDALRMNHAALLRHQVQLVREYDSDLPPIMIEKHKVLQILINLIRNAKYACDDSQRDDKRLTIRVTRAAEGPRERVRVVVADNGIGIPPENLTRIFSHGFTTRKSGHGFGLHSGALAAREMNGALSAHSDGVGRGATFVLELPVLKDDV
jgi:PAS domain S-box-containing protein